MKAIKKFLREAHLPSDLGIEACPHCAKNITDDEVEVKKMNGTHYYYHNGCMDRRPIGNRPASFHSGLNSMWTGFKDAKTPKDGNRK